MDGRLSDIWVSVRLTIELASITTVILVILGTPLAWWLARSKSMWSDAVATIIVLPPMLPQPVLGFYLLALLGPTGPGGMLASLWGERTLAFTFAGVVIGSVLSALPVVVQPIRNAFATMGDQPLEIAATLRASPSYAFLTVALPLAGPAFLTAAVLGFAHTIAAFGVVLMVGGNIPGHTKVLSAFLFDYVKASRWHEASWVAGGMLMFAFVVILILTLIDKYLRRRST
ncbi:molybdate ABC transporter permease subunit [Bradyrhizobium diazoefficiens]|uniref:molybdate ABC transporter permease subunit n=1 Tax=Bradyrhizobium diazoefficiens TaxID=1355477 RepID=UPI00190ACD60|nr:molybdate ABC transporter permease subunit [Bradyrhizobium diazoefficiens]QQO13897.1 molybdate ABC transporter permease subunit [Bradyrhizobium diazoefficiens]